MRRNHTTDRHQAKNALAAPPSHRRGVDTALIVAIIALVGAIINTIVTFVGGQLQTKGSFDAEMVKVGIEILSADPSKSDVSPARQWAIELVEQHSGKEFGVDDRNSLLHHPIGMTVFLANPNASGGIANAGCAAWKKNADGSWTQTGSILTPGNNTVSGNTLQNTSETKWLDEHCR